MTIRSLPRLLALSISTAVPLVLMGCATAPGGVLAPVTTVEPQVVSVTEGAAAPALAASGAQLTLDVRPAAPAASGAAAAPATAASGPTALAIASAASAAASAAPSPAAAASAPMADDPAAPVPTVQLAAVPSAEEEVVLRKDLWDRVRQGYAMPMLDNELVRKWEQHYSSQPEYMRRMTERGGRYLYHIVEEVEKRGMPTELALLPFVESAFNPQAMSSARASGMWQFMPGTGRQFKLKQNLFRDDRRSVLASTRAALDYLESLHRRFGDWQHALAAYNWGEGNVQRAITRNKAAGQSIDYGALSMPNETRNYVPKLQAIRNIVLKPDAFNVSLPPLQNHPYFLTVAIERDIDVALAARLAGLSLEEFQQLNPQMNKPVILAAGTPHLVLPFDNAKSFGQQLARHRGPTATWTAWIAPKTLKPAAAASMVGMSEAQLREVNRIPPRMLVKAGSTLLVPRAAQSTRDVSVQVADTAMISLAPEPLAGRKRIVRAAARGETVASVARRYKVNVNSLAQWNGVSPKASFKPSQSVVLMLPPARAKTVAKGKARGAGKSSVAAKRSTRKQASRPAKRNNSGERVAKR